VSPQAHTAKQWVGVKGSTHKRHQSNCTATSLSMGIVMHQLQTG
jgi:hypothetical protein